MPWAANPDVCDGSGTCLPNAEPSTTACRAGVDDCDATENCDGLGNCPSDGFAPPATPCGDGSDTTCDDPDTCDGAGMCLVNNDPGAPGCVVADLTISKIDLTGQVQRGAFTTYEIEVTNVGPDDADNVVVTDTLDPNTQYVASTLPCVEGPVGTLTCALGNIAALDSVTFQVVVYIDMTAPIAGTDTGPLCPGTEDVCNTATVVSDALELDPSNNTAEVATDVVAPTVVSDISVVKVDMTPEPVLPGTDVTYSIVVTNNGSDDADDVVLYETLDEFMIYVSDDAGCTPSGSPTQLTCPLGTIVSGDSVTVQVVVTIDLAAPTGSGLQDGDCNDLEDVCNFAIVGTSSSDSTFTNNRDSEPTDVSNGVNCGDGDLDAGEQCDPPSGEICNNTIDDDGDVLIDCADPDCTTPGFQSCDGNCQLTVACVPILDDPARLTWDYVKLHGRFIPTTDTNPLLDGFVFLVTNVDGEVFRAELLEGDLKVLGGKRLIKWGFKDSGAKFGMGIRDGISQVRVKQRLEPDGSISYPFKIKAYGDMSRAIKSRMTTQVYLANDVGFLTATWLGQPGRWKLTQAQADAGLPAE